MGYEAIAASVTQPLPIRSALLNCEPSVDIGPSISQIEKEDLRTVVGAELDSFELGHELG